MKGCQYVLKWKVQTAKQVANGNSIFTLMLQILEKIGCDFASHREQILLVLAQFILKPLIDHSKTFKFISVNFTNACLKCLQ